jgi:hypothetical protein
MAVIIGSITRLSAGYLVDHEVYEGRTQTSRRTAYVGSRLEPTDAWEGPA